MATVPIVRLENLTPDQIRAYVIADNRLAEKAGWDESILAIELQHLVSIDLGFEVSVTGFEVPEIDLMLDHAATKPDPEDVLEPSLSGPRSSARGICGFSENIEYSVVTLFRKIPM